MSKSKPWRVSVRTAGEEPCITYHRSAKAQNEYVRAAAQSMRDGSTNAHTITIWQWNPVSSAWSLYETLDRRDIVPETPA